MQRNKTQEEKERLIIEYSPLVKYIAYRIAVRLPPHIEIDDLISAGTIGLIDAVEKYDPSRGIKFKTYSEFRIRGAILDELRSQDWVPRSVRQRANTIGNVYLELEQKIGRPATDEEMATALNLNINDFYETLKEAVGISLLSLEGLGGTNRQGERRNILECLSGGADDDPQDSARYREIKNIIAKSIDRLSQNEQLLISLYYHEELTMKEIGEILNVTESRVSQIHTKAVLKLRAKLRKFMEE